MADAILELGLAKDFASVQDALWEVDIRILQQVFHSRGKRQGVKTKWKAPGPDDTSFTERIEKLKNRDFTWQLELR